MMEVRGASGLHGGQVVHSKTQVSLLAVAVSPGAEASWERARKEAGWVGPGREGREGGIFGLSSTQTQTSGQRRNSVLRQGRRDCC